MEESEVIDRIWLGDKLPTIYEASIHIRYLSPGKLSAKRASVLNQYTLALQHLWITSFGEDFVKDKSTISRTVKRIIDAYETFIQGNKYSKHHQKDDNQKDINKKSMRTINKEWKKHCETRYNTQNLLPSTGKGRKPKPKKSNTESDEIYAGLLDIGRNMQSLDSEENRIFYKDQSSARQHCISGEIDFEYEEEKGRKIAQQIAAFHENSMNEEHAFTTEFNEHVSPCQEVNRGERCIRRSNLTAKEFCDKEVQTPSFVKEDLMLFPRPDLRRQRNVHESVKDTVATVSYRCAISIPKARIAFQTVAYKGYGHRYYLTPDEQQKFEPSLASIIEAEEESNDAEMKEPPSKMPRTAEDYENYKNVIPSTKVCGDYKHEKALKQEVIGGRALANLEEGTRVTLHFDTTGRSRIDGEWPSLILNFLNDIKDKCKMVNLRALFFAYEDREMIVKLFVETLERLSVATGRKSSPKELWENIYAIMTDAVTKNLKIEEFVAERLNSTHIPKHILCKSHTCEKLDESCINALVEVENDIKIAELVSKKQPQLKSFVRQSRCVGLAALKAMLQLVAPEGSAKPTSLSKEFDVQLEEDGVAKTMSLYKERRFAKMGYSAAAILDCIQQYEKILEKTTHNNLLVQACKLYTQCDYIKAAFKAIGYFTYKITMPFLNCIERCDQNALLPVLKQLHDDLKEGKMDTLSIYSVNWTHINTDNLVPVSPLDNLLLNKMCIEASKGIYLQCAREYWESLAKFCGKTKDFIYFCLFLISILFPCNYI